MTYHISKRPFPTHGGQPIPLARAREALGFIPREGVSCQEPGRRRWPRVRSPHMGTTRRSRLERSPVEELVPSLHHAQGSAPTSVHKEKTPRRGGGLPPSRGQSYRDRSG